MNSAGAGSAAPVTKPGNCERIVFIGKDKHVIKHTWRLSAARGEVLLTTALANSKNPNRASNKAQAFVANDEDILSSKAAEMAHSVLKNKRDLFLKTRQGKAGGSSSSSSGSRRNADIEPIQSLRLCGVAEGLDLGWLRLRTSQTSKRSRITGERRRRKLSSLR
ncbi:unnamed protein product [Pylaiella littoralis]